MVINSNMCNQQDIPPPHPSPLRQWLPPDKVEPLGIDAETDSLKLSTAGSSKRGVKEAYQRATRYQKHLKSSSRAKTEASAGNTNTSDSEEEEEEGDSDRT